MDALLAIAAARFELSMSVPERFFAAETDRVALCCWDMAKRFSQDGRLFAFGNGAWATDAQHIAVEFVHPVIVGKRAFPAFALTNDSTALTGASFAQQLRVLARPHDIALGFSPDGHCTNVIEALQVAKSSNLLTVGMTAGDGGALVSAGLDFCFLVPTPDRFVAQETHETLYHILWELVHLFFEHQGVLS